MAVDILNLSGLRVQENEREYHIKAEPVALPGCLLIASSSTRGDGLNRPLLP
jgi:hypothetical protein